MRRAAARLRRTLPGPLARRHRLSVRTAAVVGVIVALKLVVSALGWEFVALSPLHTSIIAGSIFVIGLILAGTIGDYKESEKVPGETAAAMKSIYREGTYVKALHPEFDLDRLADVLAHIPHSFRDDLVHGTQHTVETVEGLTESFLEMERIGVPPPYITRLKQEQAVIVRNLLRVGYIQRIAFLPSAYALVESMLALVIGLLLVTEVGPLASGVVFLAFISFLFLYVIRLLRVLDTPFRPAGSGMDDISLFQIDAIHDEMHACLAPDHRDRHHLHGASVAGG